MRFGWVLVVLLACKEEPPPPTMKERALEAKQAAVEAARKAADQAKHAMHDAEERAAEAWKKLEAARAEHAKAIKENADVKGKLAALRKEADATIKLAEEKLVELRAAVVALTDKIKQGGSDTAKLEREKAELEATIAKIEKMKAELEASNRE
jgi:chromosome segregation ATPase